MTLSNVNSHLKFPYNKYCYEVGDDLPNIRKPFFLASVLLGRPTELLLSDAILHVNYQNLWDSTTILRRTSNDDIGNDTPQSFIVI